MSSLVSLFLPLACTFIAVPCDAVTSPQWAIWAAEIVKPFPALSAESGEDDAADEANWAHAPCLLGVFFFTLPHDHLLLVPSTLVDSSTFGHDTFSRGPPTLSC